MSYKDEIQQAVIVTAAQSQVVLRHNPVGCTCPEFEVQVGSRWVRVSLDDADEPETAASALVTKARTASKTGKVDHYRVVGELDTSLEVCAQGTLYLTMAVESSK